MNPVVLKAIVALVVGFGGWYVHKQQLLQAQRDAAAEQRCHLAIDLLDTDDPHRTEKIRDACADFNASTEGNRP